MLTNAKVGDVLLVQQRHESLLTTVRATTATRVRCGAWTFNRQGDSVPRQRWEYTRARIATAADIAEGEEGTRRRQCINSILKCASNINDLKKFSTEKLGRLAAVLEAN